MSGAIAAIAGVVVAGAGVGLSFHQASKSKQAQKKAEADAEAMMTQARKKLEVNYADALSINKEPYERQREAMLAVGAQALEAGVESERGATATAGRVLAAQQNLQGDIRDNMNRDLFNLDSTKAEEESRLRDVKVSMDLAEVQGAQIRSAEMENRANMQTQQAIQGTINTVQKGISMVPLYSRNTSAQKNAVGGMNFTEEQESQFGNVTGGSMGPDAGDGYSNMDFSRIGSMSNSQFRQFKRQLTPKQREMLFRNNQYTKNYQNPFEIN